MYPQKSHLRSFRAPFVLQKVCTAVFVIFCRKFDSAVFCKTGIRSLLWFVLHSTWCFLFSICFITCSFYISYSHRPWLIAAMMYFACCLLMTNWMGTAITHCGHT